MKFDLITFCLLLVTLALFMLGTAVYNEPYEEFGRYLMTITIMSIAAYL